MRNRKLQNANNHHHHHHHHLQAGQFVIFGPSMARLALSWVARSRSVESARHKGPPPNFERCVEKDPTLPKSMGHARMCVWRSVGQSYRIHVACHNRKVVRLVDVDSLVGARRDGGP